MTMTLQTVIYLLGALSVSLAMTVPATTGPVSTDAPFVALSSKDTPQDLIDRVVPLLVKSAMQEGGSYTDQLRRVVMSVIHLARSLVILKGAVQEDYDTLDHLREVDTVERTSSLTLDTIQGIFELTQETPLTTEQRLSVPDNIATILATGIKAAHQVQPIQKRGEVAEIGNSVAAILNFMKGLSQVENIQ